MNEQQIGAPRSASTDRSPIRREGRVARYRTALGASVASAALALALGACSPGTAPTTSLAIPSVDVSAAASAVAGAALSGLDDVDAAITANETSEALTTDEAGALRDLSSGLRTALQSGDTTAAQSALEELSTMVDSLASKLTGDAGTQLTEAITALRAAIPAE